MPDSVPAAGKMLRLNGMGVRTKWFFKVYVAGLYLERPTRAAEVAVGSEQVKRMDLRLLRGLSRSQITEAIDEGFAKNSGPRMGALRARLDRLNGMIPNLQAKDEILLTYVPGRGTVVTVRGVEKGVIEGKDFADALFSVWLGASPVQDDLKRDLLRG